MNDPRFFSITAWRTGNKRRQIKAENLAKDYGLSKLQPALYAGRLSVRERKEFETCMTRLLTGKRHQVHFLTSCRSFAVHSNIQDIVNSHYDQPSFEIF